MYIGGSYSISLRFFLNEKKSEVFCIFEANNFPNLKNHMWQERHFIKILSFFTDDVLLLEERLFHLSQKLLCI